MTREIFKVLCSKLNNILIVKKFFNIKTCPCYDLSVLAIDMDATKEIICKQLKQKTRKSCDALVVLTNNLDYIEFKSFKDLIRRSSNEDRRELIQKKIDKYRYDLKDKLEDSFFIMNCLVRYKDINLTREQLRHFDNLSIYYFILVDFDLENDPAKRLASKIILKGDRVFSDYDNIFCCLEEICPDVQNKLRIKLKHVTPIDCRGLIERYLKNNNLILDELYSLDLTAKIQI